MPKIFRACRKKVIEGREKPVWDEVGLKLIIGEYNNMPTYSIADGRTGEMYTCFPIEKRGGSQNSGGSNNPDW